MKQKYLGVSGTIVEDLTGSYLDQLYEAAKEKIFNHLEEAKNDKEFVRLLDDNYRKLKLEALSLPIPHVATYFSQNPKPTLNTPPYSLNKRYAIDGHRSVRIYQEKIGKIPKVDSSVVVILMPIMNAAVRITKGLDSIIKSFDPKQKLLFVICINNTVDNSFNEVKEFFLKNAINAVVNIVPKGSVKVSQPSLNRTVAQNINLRTIEELNISDSNFLFFIEDDILLPEKGGVKKIIEFMKANRRYKVVGFNPVAYPENFLKKINYSFHPLYYQGLLLMGKMVVSAPMPQPEIHGGAFVIRRKDHPRQLPHDLIAQDGWLSNLFTQEGSIGSTRFTNLLMYHHEPTCLARRISKIKSRNLSYGPKELWNKFLVDKVSRNNQEMMMTVYKTWPKRDSSFGLLIRTLKS